VLVYNKGRKARFSFEGATLFCPYCLPIGLYLLILQGEPCEVRLYLGIKTNKFVSLCSLFALISQTAKDNLMKKYQKDFRVVSADRLTPKHVRLRLVPADGRMPEMTAGQFAEVRVDGEQSTFLRRPISLHNVDEEKGELWLLVAMIGKGTKQLGKLSAGDTLNLLLPLGRGFSLPDKAGERCLLVGGGVGAAPLLMLGKALLKRGCEPTFLLGGRSEADIVERGIYEEVGRVFLTTEDGTAGERGFVTNHSILSREHFDRIATCGPKPMMQAVARYARAARIPCEASLENMMACGLGACLCCVEQTISGHKCVCKEGPVFNVNELVGDWER